MANHISICSVFYDGSSDKYGSPQKWLNRLVDVNMVMGRLFEPDINSYAGNTFDNRTRLYCRRGEGPDEERTIGVWNWSASPRDTDPTRDYIDASYTSDVVPIEIIRCGGSTKALLDGLVAGMALKYHMHRLLLYAEADKWGKWDCIYCDNHNTTFMPGEIKIKSDCAKVQTYKIDRNECINTAVNVSFYKYLQFKEEGKTVSIRDIDDVVKETIVERFSWKEGKAAGLEKKAWQALKEFVNTASDDIISDIMEKGTCSRNEAEQAVLDFFKKGDDSFAGILVYISDDEIEDVLDHNPSLNERFAEAFNEKSAGLQKAIDEKESELELLGTEKEGLTSIIESLKKEIDDLTAEKSEIQSDISDKRAEAELVIDAIRERVSSVRNDALKAVEEVPLLAALISKPIENSYKYGTDIIKSVTSAYTPGKEYVTEESEVHESWEDEIYTLTESLEAVGIDGEFASGLAMLLYSAYGHHIPLLIAGPCGESIANALSVSLFGKSAGCLDCSGDVSSRDIQNAIQLNDPVIIIRSPFKSDHFDRIGPLLQAADKYYVLLTPFSEDLIIEPDGILNYTFPIFTELLLDQPAVIPTYTAGIRCDGFQEYPKQDHAQRDVFPGLLLPALSKRMASHVLDDCLELNRKDSDIDLMSLYGVVPYGYITNQTEKVIQLVLSEPQLSIDLKQKLLGFLGYMDE